MTDIALKTSPPIRNEFLKDTLDASQVGAIERPLSMWERITNIAAVRRVFILVLLALIWQIYSTQLNNPLMFPTFSDTAQAFWTRS